jgi:fructose-1,6-bisphosphatase I
MGFPLRFSDVTRTIPTSLAEVIAHVGLVGKLVAQDLRRAALLNILGATGATNVQGEAVKKLDERANQTFLDVFQRVPSVWGLASEEMEKPVVFSRQGSEAT